MESYLLPQRLKKLREGKDLSQYDLAEALGYSRGQIANYEQGTRKPDPTTLQHLASYFGVTVDYLLGRTDDPRPLKKASSPENETRGIIQKTNPEIVDLLKRVPDLTEEEQESLAEHWKWAMGIIEEERERRNKFQEKFKGKDDPSSTPKKRR